MSTPGATAEAPHAPAPASPVPLREACPLCGSPLASDQDWCLRCGAAARTRLAASPGWRAPLLAAAIVVALALGVLAAALVKLAGEETPGARTTTLTTAAAAPNATATAPGAVAPGASTGTGTTTSTAAAGGTPPAGKARPAGPRTSRPTKTGAARRPPAAAGRSGGAIGGVSPLIEKRIREIREKSGR